MVRWNRIQHGGPAVSKKRFVEFYLAAMLKQASEGRVTRLTYTYFDLAHSEIVRVDYETGTGAVEFPVNNMGLLEIAAEVIEQTRRALA